MNLLKSLLSLFSVDCHRPEYPLKSKHTGRLERSRMIAVRDGQITLAQIGGNSPAKVAQRLREQGYLKAHGASGAERWETNQKTGSDYKVYIATGKIPPNWIKSDAYIGRDRRKTPRGQK